jgi:hypothetical protein
LTGSIPFRALWLLSGAFFLMTFAAAAQKPRLKTVPYRDVNANRATSGTFHLVAVMVEFKEDDNRFTSGNGKFNPDYLDRDDILIDPLPHDGGYFQAHLDFAKHYFETVSNGNLLFQTHSIPGIITLPNEMAAYAPLESSSDESFRLADLAADTWQAVMQQGGTTLPPLPADRTAWIIFHAGAGRDIELLGTTLDKTPQDIPSLYLGLERLHQLRPDRIPSNGIALDAGNRVTNVLIIPETESRQGTAIDNSKFVLQLGINGILCANIGNFLGLPDLFNTSDGQSGIGGFGLMDGAGFFAMAGVFPPEPSAWEKIDRGWLEPRIIDENGPVSFQTFSLSSRLYSVPVKVQAGINEYFLIENRHRNPDPAGVTLTIRKPNGQLVQQTFSPADYQFDFMNTDSLQNRLEPGVVVAVNNYDRALPGGADAGEDGIYQSGERILNGGMLIWHIDEAVIAAKRASNAINNDPLRRGIDLEEADGAQDIGRPIAGSLNTALASGTAFDFWWNGNDSRVILQNGSEITFYTNRFSDTTTPDARLNDGSLSGIEFSAFSENILSASFSITRNVSTGAKKILSLNRAINAQTMFAVAHTATDSTLIALSGNRLVFAPFNSSVFATDSISFEADNSASLHFDSISEHAFLLENNRLRAFAKDAQHKWRLSWTQSFSAEVETKSYAATALYTFSRGASRYVGIQGTTHCFSVITGTSAPFSTPRFAGLEPDNIYVSGSTLFKNGQQIPLPFPASAPKRILTYKQGAAAVEAVIISPDGIWLSETNTILPVNASPSAFLWLSPAPEKRIVFSSPGEKWSSVFASGAHETNWPQSSPGVHPDQITIFGSPEDAPHFWLKRTEHGLTRLVSYAISGEQASFTGYLKTVTLQSQHAQFTGAGNTLYVLDENATLFALPQPENRQSFYNSAAGHPFNAVLPEIAIAPSNGSLLIDTETYNWPNPATDETFVRFQTSVAADVSITVIDMGGQIRQRVRAAAHGRTPDEIRLDTSKLTSGVYLIAVEARASGKSTARKRIKMAIIR